MREGSEGSVGMREGSEGRGGKGWGKVVKVGEVRDEGR